MSILSAITYPIRDPYGMAPTGSIVLQAPLCRARLNDRRRKPSIDEIVYRVSLVIEANTVLFLGWGIQWDDWMTSNCDEQVLYVVICDMDFLVFDIQACRGMVQPTKRKRGQYERVGLVIFMNAEPEKLLAISKNFFIGLKLLVS